MRFDTLAGGRRPAAWRVVRGPALALLVLLAPGALMAQGWGVPAGNSLPNYDRVPIGQREGLESGAFIARSDDAGAPWYNPAGLVQSERSGINASANAYELLIVKLQEDQGRRESTRFSPRGTYFGGVIGSPVVHSPRLRLGFFYATPIAWDPGAINGYRDQSSDGARTTVEYVLDGAINSYVPGVAAGWKVRDGLRVGASLGWTWTSLRQNQAVTDRFLAETSDTTRSRLLLANGQTRGLALTLGGQWAIGGGLVAGLKFTTPTLRTGGGATVLAQNDRYFTGGSIQRSFRDESARFNYPLPLVIAGGLAWQGEAAELEVDVRYHASKSPFELLSTSLQGEQVTTSAGAPPVTEVIPFAPVVEAWRSVVNVQVGGNIRLNKAWRLHGGFYTDQSPVADPATSIFRSVNLFGTSIGARISGRHLSGSIGLTAGWGSAAPRSIGPIVGGDSTTTTLKVQTLTLLYSLAYAF